MALVELLHVLLVVPLTEAPRKVRKRGLEGGIAHVVGAGASEETTNLGLDEDSTEGFLALLNAEFASFLLLLLGEGEGVGFLGCDDLLVAPVEHHQDGGLLDEKVTVELEVAAVFLDELGDGVPKLLETAVGDLEPLVPGCVLRDASVHRELPFSPVAKFVGCEKVTGDCAMVPSAPFEGCEDDLCAGLALDALGVLGAFEGLADSLHVLVDDGLLLGRATIFAEQNAFGELDDECLSHDV